jgi:very-short-patch-repair endonuclease
MHGLKFKRQYSIDAFVVDFYAPKIKLAIEVDGENHDRPLQKEYDEVREEYIKNAGITFARLSNQQIEDDIISVLNEISELTMALGNKE